MRMHWAFAALLVGIPLGLLARETYEIRIHSPESWAHYYRLIGLGNTVDARPGQEAHYLNKHCDFLTEVTGHDWLPLGYSAERGLRLCYRTSPFSRREAHVLCARLLMAVVESTAQRIVCRMGSDTLLRPGREPMPEVLS